MCLVVSTDSFLQRSALVYLVSLPHSSVCAIVALWISFVATHSVLSITLGWNLQLASGLEVLFQVHWLVGAILVLVVVGLMSLFSCWVPAENCFQFLEISWFLAIWPLWTPDNYAGAHLEIPLLLPNSLCIQKGKLVISARTNQMIFRL